MYVFSNSSMGSDEGLFGLGQEEDQKKAMEEALKAGRTAGGIEIMSAKVVDAEGNPVPDAQVTVLADGRPVTRIDASNGYYIGERISFGQPTSNWQALIDAPDRIPVPAPVCNTSPDGKAWFPWTCGVLENPIRLLKSGADTALILTVVGALVIGGLAAYSIFRASLKGRLVGGGKVI